MTLPQPQLLGAQREDTGVGQTQSSSFGRVTGGLGARTYSRRGHIHSLLLYTRKTANSPLQVIFLFGSVHFPRAL